MGQDGPLGHGRQEGTAHRGRRGWHVGAGGRHTWPHPEPRKPSCGWESEGPWVFQFSSVQLLSRVRLFATP